MAKKKTKSIPTKKSGTEIYNKDILQKLLKVADKKGYFQIEGLGFDEIRYPSSPHYFAPKIKKPGKFQTVFYIRLSKNLEKGYISFATGSYAICKSNYEEKVVIPIPYLMTFRDRTLEEPEKTFEEIFDHLDENARMADLTVDYYKSQYITEDKIVNYARSFCSRHISVYHGRVNPKNIDPTPLIDGMDLKGGKATVWSFMSVLFENMYSHKKETLVRFRDRDGKESFSADRRSPIIKCRMMAAFLTDIELICPVEIDDKFYQLDGFGF